MTVSLIWAEAANGVIGDGGRLPWHLPEDLARFRELTLGSTVVMGRATWESLPDRARPLPGRRNVVLSRRPGWSASGAEVAGSLEEALAAAPGEVWVIGGASVYRAALPLADRVVLTRLEREFAGDVRAPQLGAGWVRVGPDPAAAWQTSRTGLRFRVDEYARARHAPAGPGRRADRRADGPPGGSGPPDGPDQLIQTTYS